MSSKQAPVHLVIVTGALFFGAAMHAPSLQAQSCDDVLVHSSYPADGASGVPTNSPLIIYGPALEADGVAVTLQDASGEDVPNTVMPTEGGLFVDPFLGLAPNTTYEATVTPRAGGPAWSASFETGTGPALPSQVEAPDVDVSVIDGDMGSCGVVSAICVIGSVPARMTLEVLVGDEVLSLGGGQPAPTFPVDAGPIADGDCIEVRVREPGGFVSESTRRCGSELGRFELAANAAAPTSCDAYRIRNTAAASTADESEASESGGCALRNAGAASSAGGMLAGLAALIAARRRRRPH